MDRPLNISRIDWDLRRRAPGEYEKYWEEKNLQVLPPELFGKDTPVWLEVGAGSGWFCVEMAKLHPEAFLVAIERSKMRGQRLVRKAAKSGQTNIAAFRGNAIPALIHGIPSASVERVYLLYPCPWPRTSQRKNRWYLHPIMPHLVRILKKDGMLVWASDQKFYIDEARFVCEQRYGMEVLAHGAIAPNAYNDLEHFPTGRSKFEQTFLGQGLPCYEVIARKTTDEVAAPSPV